MTPSYLLTLLAAASLTAALGDLAASVAFRDGPSEVSAGYRRSSGWKGIVMPHREIKSRAIRKQ